MNAVKEKVAHYDLSAYPLGKTGAVVEHVAPSVGRDVFIDQGLADYEAKGNNLPPVVNAGIVHGHDHTHGGKDI